MLAAFVPAALARGAPSGHGSWDAERTEGAPLVALPRYAHALAPSAPRPALLREGETCWRLEHASRAAFLVDGQDYFGTVAAAIERARYQILLLGWDFHGRIRLRRRRRPRPDDELLGLLGQRLAACPGLRVYGLGWGLGSLLAFSRERLPELHLGLHGIPRLDFRLDRSHPWLACHHQKVVVIDDRLAFAGGFDVTAYRWDSREHLPEDPRRVTPEGQPYGPFHDVQLAVEGDAAQALGLLARDRWRRATGEILEPPPPAPSPWPASLAAPLHDVRVGIARTDPGYAGGAPAREVERLYLEAIAAARRWIYFENQYLTSSRLVEALAARLGEDAGPEIVLVLPAHCPGWLEELSMGRLRADAVARLRAADRHGRLRLFAPVVAPGVSVTVHAKVLVVDDAFVRIGSSNLTSRSLAVDTECDLAVEAAGRVDVAGAIARFRNGLVAEHLGATPDAVRGLLRSERSLVRAIEALRGGRRTLGPLPPVERTDRIGALAAKLLDPGCGDAAAGARGEEPRSPLSPRALALAFAALLLALALVAALPLR